MLNIGELLLAKIENECMSNVSPLQGVSFGEYFQICFGSNCPNIETGRDEGLRACNWCLAWLWISSSTNSPITQPEGSHAIVKKIFLKHYITKHKIGALYILLVFQFMYNEFKVTRSHTLPDSQWSYSYPIRKSIEENKRERGGNGWGGREGEWQRGEGINPGFWGRAYPPVP